MQMSARLHRTVQISAPRALEALQFAGEVAQYINANSSGMQVTAHVERFGKQRVHFFADADDIAALERAQDALLADQDYLAIVAKGAELFIDGTLEDTVTVSL
jgi:hypothetical protein